MDFDNSVDYVSKLMKVTDSDVELSSEEKLKIYSLYKQSVIGDCNTEKPSFFHFVKSAKWNSWNELKGTSHEDAKNKYIAFVNELKIKYDQSNFA